MKEKTKIGLVGGKTPDIGTATGTDFEPWWAKKAIPVIRDLLKKTDVGFEFGGGMSTLWLARRVKHLYTVENVPRWIERLQQGLLEEQVFNVSLLRYAKNDHMYADCINHFPDNYFDFIVVDGHQRERCIRNAKPKLKREGYLIVDDTNWIDGKVPMKDLPQHIKSLESWRNIQEMLKAWSQGLWQDCITKHKGTSIYRKQ